MKTYYKSTFFKWLVAKLEKKLIIVEKKKNLKIYN